MSILISYHHHGMGKIRWKTRCFHAKFQDKNKKWKNKYKTMFSYKMVNFIWILDLFCSRFTHSCLWPFSFHSFLLPHDFRPPTRSESACLYIVGGASLDFILRRKGQSHDVAHKAWQRPYSERSRPLRTSSILYRLHPIGFSRGGV